ncbi:hypothetical protein AS224_17065 [Enterococcus faecium]|nr:hypothetical protein AS224_17065 [Enterococcus faecium]
MNKLPPKYPSVSLTFFLSKTLFFIFFRQNRLPYQGQVIHQQEFAYFPQQTKDKERLTYYVLNDITDFEIWEIERELQLMQTDPEILW